jgi:hypothetical protein
METLLGRPLEELVPEREDKDDDSDDDEFLSMGKTASFANKKSKGSSPPTASARASASSGTTEMASHSLARDERGSGKGKEVVTTATAAAQDAGKEKGGTDDEEDEEDDELFEFESGLTPPPKRRPRPLAPVRDDDDEDDDKAGAPTVQAVTKAPLSQFSSSPAVAITRPNRDTAVAAPPTPTTARFQTGSLGSYRGRPVMMPVVTNPAIQAQAENMGEFSTFVGGLDGRSGMDAGDMNSFRASLALGAGSFSGAPRSLTERMMMEDAAAEASALAETARRKGEVRKQLRDEPATAQ